MQELVASRTAPVAAIQSVAAYQIKGAGNCQMELLLGFLHNPKFRLRPLLQCIEGHIEPLREKLMWGFDLPYMITGLLNQHPRSGMAFNADENKGSIVDFYDEMEEEE